MFTSICFSGNKLNLDYYINANMEKVKQDEIIDYFVNAESDSIQDAMEEFGDYYTEEN